MRKLTPVALAFSIVAISGCCPPPAKCAPPAFTVQVTSASGAPLSDLKVLVDGQEQFASEGTTTYLVFGIPEGAHALSVSSSNHAELQTSVDYAREEDDCGFAKPLMVDVTLQPDGVPTQSTLTQTRGLAGRCG